MIKNKLLVLTLALSCFMAWPAHSEKTLKFVPHADLKVLDPILTTGYVTRNHGYMIYDTLFAMDKDYKPQPQMVDTWETSKDGLTWTFTLRDGLKWHDGKPVTSEDCIASLSRWGKADGFGQILFNDIKSLEAVNEKTFKINLKKPFPGLLNAIGKLSSNVPFMMPKRVAETDPKKAIEDYTGSGPYVFKKDEWVPGSKIVYVKNKDYVPRKEPASLASGGKVVKVDRVEWLYLPDATTTMAALQKGEIHFWENPAADLVPVLESDKNLDLSKSVKYYSIIRFNATLPPFDNPKVRQAVLMAANQSEYMAASTPGPKYHELCYSVFTCGTPFANDANTNIQKNGSLDKAKAALNEAGYDGTPVAILHTNDIDWFRAFGLLTAENLRNIGMKVDLQTLDWGTVLSRRASREPVKNGGWNIFHTAFATPDMLDPVNIWYSADPEKGWFGWPSDAELEKQRANWLNAESEELKKAAAVKYQERFLEVAPWVPLGIIIAPFAIRKEVKGVLDAPLPLLWNIDIEG